MTYRGRVKSGVVVLDKGVALPEGTPVAVQALKRSPRKPSNDPVYRIGDLAVPTGIPDLGMNIDHYLYGHPKVSKGKRGKV
jgi:hypothetical protein